MDFLHKSSRSVYATSQLEWCNERCNWTQWKLVVCSGNVFSAVMNHASLSGSLMGKSEFGRCQEYATYRNAEWQQ